MSGALLRALADTSIRASIAAVLVAAALAAVRARAAAVRHASWTAVLFAMLLMPALTRWMPAVTMPLSITMPALPGSVDGSAHDMPSDLRGSEGAPAEAAASTRPGDAPAGGILPVTAITEPATVPAHRRSPADVAVLVVCGLYAVVAAAMLTRFLVGWWGAARLARAADAVSPPRECLPVLSRGATLDIRESLSVAVPVTIGLLRQTILLPAAWRRWPVETVRAVLAHEAAHIRRRDVPIAFAALLNRCLLWFHPLSWWLERTLAATAEQSADEAGISALGERAAYAAILVEMARAVSHGRGRITRLGVGIDGSGLLSERIERALSGGPDRQMSGMRKAILSVICVGAILIAVACRPSATTIDDDARLERRDRTLRLALLQTERRQWRDFENIDWETEANAVTARAAAVRDHPDDLAALRMFLVSYWAQYAPTSTSVEQNPLVANKVVDPGILAVRRVHILRLIERHPDADLAGSAEVRIFPTDLVPFFPGDPLGYEQARAAWIAQTRKPDVSPVVLGHAADFFEAAERPVAEQLLVRARALDPDGPWVARLGRLYKSVLAGSLERAGRNHGRRINVAEPHTAYGNAVRARLAGSNDDVLLTAAGWFLPSSGQRSWMDGDPGIWAETCFTRALQINPHAILAHSALLEARRQIRNREPLWRMAPASLDAGVAALPARERFQQLPELARKEYRVLTEIEEWNDGNLRGRIDLARGHAQRYAEETLRLAPEFRDDPDYGTAIYTANMTLSALALRDGDRRTAVGYLQRASQAPPSEQLTYGDDVVWRRELRDLAASGERQAVIAFLEQMARTNISGRTDLREWATSIRRGGAANGPYFDAARVTRNTSGDRRFVDDPHARIGSQAGGICAPWGWIGTSDTCVTATNFTLRELIAYTFAPYGLLQPLPEIVDGPAWIDDDRFDIVGRAAGTTPAGPLGTTELAARMRTLLEERFTLALHHENRPRLIYELVQLGGDRRLGPRLHPATPACAAVGSALRASIENAAPALLPSRHDPCIPIGGRGYIKGGAIDMAQLALGLSNRLNRVVRDRTNLSGMFALDLTWNDGPSLFGALEEQLGLKLESTTRPVDALVVDRVSPPRVN